MCQALSDSPRVEGKKNKTVAPHSGYPQSLVASGTGTSEKHLRKFRVASALKIIKQEK